MGRQVTIQLTGTAGYCGDIPHQYSNYRGNQTIAVYQDQGDRTVFAHTLRQTTPAMEGATLVEEFVGVNKDFQAKLDAHINRLPEMETIGPPDLSLDKILTD